MPFPNDRSNDPKAPITWGRQQNFFQKTAVSVSTFNTDCDVLIPFTTQGFQFVNLGTTSTQVVEYSFNGNDLHGELNPATGSATQSIMFNPRVACKIWFRIQSGSTGPVTVSVQAWATVGG
jgi:hypothetical protein